LKGSLKLRQRLSRCRVASYNRAQAAESGITVIRARVGVFFSGIVAGCRCADDPTPVEPQDEYCEFQFEIDRATDRAAILQGILQGQTT
jgi:hypothetical protein